jgi:predicted CopG family antitoxin
MLHELTITVDDAVYQTLKPMVEQQTIGSFLHEFVQNRTRGGRSTPAITSFRGTLHPVDMSDIRDEADRSL